ncbi:MAG: hypothetical protein QNJ51_11575 [Calothrix sp. MO_167.B12]|nr:hypothetical protein [Calothrix sp. MO_167.B12]
MNENTQGIPGLPDITHPVELMEFGNQVIKASLILVILVLMLGIVMALVNFSLRRHQTTQNLVINDWLQNYSQWLRGLPHITLLLIILIGGFFLCSTLGNRYHHWEQAKIAKVAESVAGERLEQIAPQIRYTVQQPYSYTTRVKDKIVKVNDTQTVSRFLNLAGSQIQVKIDQTVDVRGRSTVYQIDYNANYKVVNQLQNISQFFFEAPPPQGYSLLASYQVERGKSKLLQRNPGDYGFPFRLEPGEEANFRVTYQAQGGPRWIYKAGGQLLSNFRLDAIANFQGANFASGIVPNQIQNDGKITQFTWIFEDNVSVRNPLGVFTDTEPIQHTGIIPHLLLLAPGLFLWWILLLYLSLPMHLKNVAIAGGIFFACLLALTYLSRWIAPPVAWSLIALILLSLTWGLGSHRRASLAAIICTIAGAVIPIFGLLIPFTGLTLSLAGLLSATWLAVRHWYGWWGDGVMR